jgi:hypothetical protein
MPSAGVRSAVVTASRHHPASRLPSTECTRAEIAPGTAVSGSAAKCLRASTTPRPEFCMPVSIAIVRAATTGNPDARAKP